MYIQAITTSTSAHSSMLHYAVVHYFNCIDIHIKICILLVMVVRVPSLHIWQNNRSINVTFANLARGSPRAEPFQFSPQPFSPDIIKCPSDKSYPPAKTNDKTIYIDTYTWGQH